MNARHQDWEWLREFTRNGDQAAFASIVRRHLDLVYGTAFRKVEDAGGAEEVSQNVFSALARKAWRFAPDDSLPAWLYRTALLESRHWLRHELRRRRREQTAAQLGTTMKTPDQEPAFQALVPALDEGLLSLREKDRAALLLRYYESRPLREVGAALGVSEDVARKRVDTALQALSLFFRRRGFRTATVAGTAAALAHTAKAAPAALGIVISKAALSAAPPALGGLTGVLGRLAGLTKIQTVSLCLALVSIPTGWQWRQAMQARNEAVEAQITLDQARDQGQELSLAVEQLQTQSARLDSTLADVERVSTQAAQAASQVDALKLRLRALLAAAESRWPDDLPFVRIPKSDIKELRPGRAIDRTGNIQDWGAELLCLTPDEKQRTEQALRDHAEAAVQSALERAYATNYLPPNVASHWAGKPYQSVCVPPPGNDPAATSTSLLAEIAQIIGEERAQLLLGEGNFIGIGDWFGILEGSPKGDLLTVCVDRNDPDGLACGQYWNGSGGYGVFTRGNEVRLAFIPDPIARKFFDPWLEQLGITNSITTASP
jgi:RNA polymerase sigma factor (sigma-70 family)